MKDGTNKISTTTTDDLKDTADKINTTTATNNSKDNPVLKDGTDKISTTTTDDLKDTAAKITTTTATDDSKDNFVLKEFGNFLSASNDWEKIRNGILGNFEVQFTEKNASPLYGENYF